MSEDDAWNARSKPHDLTFTPKPVNASAQDVTKPAPVQPDVSQPGLTVKHQSPYDLLAAPSDRESIADALVELSMEKLSRVALLKVKDGMLTGWRCALSGGAADISRLGITLALPGIFKGVVEEKSLYKGPLVPLPQNETLVNALGGGGPVEAVACPLVIREKVVAVLYGDNGQGSVTRCEMNFFASLMAKASMSLEILILKNKILS